VIHIHIFMELLHRENEKTKYYIKLLLDYAEGVDEKDLEKHIKKNPGLWNKVVVKD